MTIKRLIPGILVASLPITLIPSSPAEAAVVFLERNTQLVASGMNCENNGDPCYTTSTVQAGSTTFAPYSDSLSYAINGGTLASASQTSTLDDNRISADVLVSAIPAMLASSNSSFSVRFSLDTSTYFTLVGGSSYRPTEAGASILLTGPGTNISQRPDPSGAIPGMPDQYIVNASGVLDPGIYTLAVSASTTPFAYNGSAHATAELNLSPVPLPGSLTLLLSAASALVAWAKRNTAASVMRPS